MLNSKLDQSLPATTFTKKNNEAVKQFLNFEDRQDFENAKKGFIAPLLSKTLKSATGRTVWDTGKSEFLQTETDSETVNPSLWRNSQLQAISGLFKVVDGVYQVRGQSLATTFLIEGDNGVIVCDTGATVESAKAVMELYYTHRPKKPVTAIIISQSHADHFSGIQGILDYAEHPNIPIIAPEHFTEETLSENVLLGPIMRRRAEYQFGFNLDSGPRGVVSIGIGPISMSGTQSFEVPTVEINEEVQKMVVDGITFQFLLTPNTEAPVEMHFYIPNYKVLFVSENVNRSMHQIYTVRGAKTRDSLLWADAIDKTIELFKDEEIDALLMAHGWSEWGKEQALGHLKLQRDLYKYMHDQTVRLANHGYTMDEIAETIKLPDVLSKHWGNREYYGTLKHNVKGIYNFYLGYYSGHPSDLDALPQVESGIKYVQYMGGAKNVMKQAKIDFENGEYRWVAQVLKNVVMADPNNTEAKNLLADTFEQLGYQAESANWRNIYLVGAFELRNGIVKDRAPLDTSGFVSKTPVLEFLKLFAARLNGLNADGKKITINVTLSDENKDYTLYLENSVLTYKSSRLDTSPDASLIVDKLTFYGIANGRISPQQAVADAKLELSGDQHKLADFLSLFDRFNPLANIVIP
ncbi:alkyl/aryl-sulfatase [Solibacillus sp. FSL K6-1523]|uniref:alkyl/aryl-sulfatase n=1 Tax=Solibacillus sp. FSL K6-1523 TaxID=2921471 RepID=UPI0030FB1C5F